jgi:hypothetical protein
MYLPCHVPTSPADALSSSSSEFGSSAKDAATGLKDKAKAALKDATSAVPNTTSEVADVPFFRGRKDSFKSDAEKDPSAGVCVCVCERATQRLGNSHSGVSQGQK